MVVLNGILPPPHARIRALETRPHRLARSRTPPFHGGDRGSNPLGDANTFPF